MHLTNEIVLFDLDGTVIDSLEGIMNAIDVCFAHAGLPPITTEEFLPFVGPPIIDTLQTHFHLTKAQAQDAMTAYHSYYRVKGWKQCRLYDGMPALFAALKAKGKKLGLATNKPHEYAQEILEDKKVAHYFDYIGGTTDTIHEKSQVVADCLAHLGSDAIMVGDRKFDVEGAKKAGVSTVGITYGYCTREELLAAGAIWVVDTPEEVVALF